MRTNNTAYHKPLLIFFLLFITLSLIAKKKEKNERNFLLSYGYVIGGTTPMPMPVEIRSIKSFNPKFHYSIGYEIQNRFNTFWGINTGIRMETNGMETKAEVKNYNMDMIKDGNRMVGYYYGTVKTNVNCTFLTIPILVTYHITPIMNIKIGPYCQLALNRHFSGIVYDGYLRVDDGRMNNGISTGPTGQKVEITSKNPATYDFSSNMQPFQFGLEFGTELRLTPTYGVFVYMNCGLNDVFKKEFDIITFKMFPIYASIGFTFHFKESNAKHL